MPKPAESKKKKGNTGARLGIFWLVDGKLLIESAPLSECEQYGDHLNYPGSHVHVWEQSLRIGKAPAASEYEEFPRGRVIHDMKTKQFSLLADKCILKHRGIIAAIKKELRLPKQISLGTDPHYRCFHCLHGNTLDEE